MKSHPIDRSLSAVYGWSAFLGISWTWCVGMFLPVLLVRDHGFWGWLIFALPNVVGAAAMGTVLAAPGKSRRMIEPHRAAGIVFSLVTIGFHIFFVTWVVRGMIGPIAIPITGVAAIVLFIAGRRGRRDLSIAVVIFVLSTIAFACFAGQGAPAFDFTRSIANKDLLPLAAVCVFGFAFCPYLDLTFHRARQSTAPVAGMSAFAIGFGVMFFIMICFTLWYAKVMIPGTWGRMNRTVAWLLAGHMMLQAAYTISVHFREVLRQWESADRQVKAGSVLGLVLGAMPLVTTPFISHSLQFADRQELTYRLFMSFYALLFPSYVWICMTPIPTTSVSSKMTSQLVTFLVAVLIAAPFYWMGFINRQMQWVLLGVAVIVIARIASRLFRDRAPS